jgi:hypothetical protein
MKNLFYIVVILFVVSCKNTTKDISSKKSINTDTTTEFPKMKAETPVKISEAFIINGMKCNWRQIDSSEGETTLEVKDYKTQKILLSYSDYFRTENDFNSADYFNEHFQDVILTALKTF